MRAQVIDNDKRHAPTGARPGDSGPDLGAEDISGAAGGQPAFEPAVTLVDEPEAIDLVVGPRCFDQALATPTFAAPHARQRGMERELDLVLEIDIGTRQKRQQRGQVWWHVLQEVRFDKSGNGWRCWRASPSQDYLHPQAFPT